MIKLPSDLEGLVISQRSHLWIRVAPYIWFSSCLHIDAEAAPKQVDLSSSVCAAIANHCGDNQALTHELMAAQAETRLCRPTNDGMNSGYFLTRS